jgi:DNA invertase Pin-like site-specific DNA recombinase
VHITSTAAPLLHTRPVSLQDVVGFLSELHALRIDLFLHQQGLGTTTPGGKAMFQMLGVSAEFERSMIQERVRAGLRRAKDQGKQLGRPRIAPDLEKRILAALNARYGNLVPSIPEVGEAMGRAVEVVAPSSSL